MKTRQESAHACFIISQLRLTIVIVLLLLTSTQLQTFAAEETTVISGTPYICDYESDYDFSTDTVQPGTECYGLFSIDGSAKPAGMKNGVPAFMVQEGNLSLSYSHDGSLLTAAADHWHLFDDKSKEVNGIKLPDKLHTGALIVQTSLDHRNWNTTSVLTNIFMNDDLMAAPIHTTQDIELINGCFYRVIVAYGTEIMVEPGKVLFVSVDKYDYEKHADVYEFYAQVESNTLPSADDNSTTYHLGDKVKAEDSSGYSGKQDITEDDPHFGWDLGKFFVSGYTSYSTSEGKNITFLKNPGDKVTLWFKLEQPLDQLNGNRNLSISADETGTDEGLEASANAFGRGALIIRYTDPRNDKHDPIIYTDYLAAHTSFNSNTKVQLFEEGDYEVALDYKILEDKLISKYHPYRIYFTFSIRNGNSMFYAFDTETQGELFNGSMTENGFRIDLANSKYLDLYVKKEILVDGADGLTEDSRFNRTARDGAVFTDEGIYTITAHNNVTNKETVKRIYVGQDHVLKAHIATGYPIHEIRLLVDQGATIYEDGSIHMPETGNITLPEPFPTPLPEESDPAESELTQVPEETPIPAPSETPDTSSKETHDLTFIIPLVIAALCGIAAAVILIIRKRGGSKA